MKKSLYSFAILFLLLLGANNLKAQYYCFFVDNQSNQVFYELRIRPTGTNRSFSNDLLPDTEIRMGKHYWVKTGNDDYNTYDVQLIDQFGEPLLFSWKDVSGNWHDSKPFISVNVKELHTLVIGSGKNGSLNFGVYNTDRFKYGHPCEQ